MRDWMKTFGLWTAGRAACGLAAKGAAAAAACVMARGWAEYFPAASSASKAGAEAAAAGKLAVVNSVTAAEGQPAVAFLAAASEYWQTYVIAPPDLLNQSWNFEIFQAWLAS